MGQVHFEATADVQAQLRELSKVVAKQEEMLARLRATKTEAKGAGDALSSAAASIGNWVSLGAAIGVAGTALRDIHAEAVASAAGIAAAHTSLLKLSDVARDWKHRSGLEAVGYDFSRKFGVSTEASMDLVARATGAGLKPKDLWRVGGLAAASGAETVGAILDVSEPARALFGESFLGVAGKISGAAQGEMSKAELSKALQAAMPAAREAGFTFNETLAAIAGMEDEFGSPGEAGSRLTALLTAVHRTNPRLQGKEAILGFLERVGPARLAQEYGKGGGAATAAALLQSRGQMSDIEATALKAGVDPQSFINASVKTGVQGGVLGIETSKRIADMRLLVERMQDEGLELTATNALRSHLKARQLERGEGAFTIWTRDKWFGFGQMIGDSVESQIKLGAGWLTNNASDRPAVVRELEGVVNGLNEAIQNMKEASQDLKDGANANKRYGGSQAADAISRGD